MCVRLQGAAARLRADGSLRVIRGMTVRGPAVLGLQAGRYLRLAKNLRHALRIGGRIRGRLCAPTFGVLLGVALVNSGCQTLTGEPERLYTMGEEAAAARDVELPKISAAYDAAMTDPDRMRFRNEYVARRMYIIDLAYTEFETALTRERQEFGLGSALTAQGLSTAGAVFTAAHTVRLLSALASGANAARGFYDSELLVNKSIQIVQSQMQSKRDDVATRIFSRVRESTLTYSLSAALHDLEDYYRAGTLTSGLIKAAAEAAISAQTSAENKAAAIGAQAVITDVRQPLPTPQPFTSGSGLNGFERAITDDVKRMMLTALCVPSPPSTFGPLDSAARKTLSDFFDAAGMGKSQTVASTAMRNKLNKAILKVKANHGGTCTSAGFHTAREVGLAVK